MGHDWNLPGRGSSGDSCGRFLPLKTFGCPEGHEVHAVRCSCHRMDCPVCFPDAVSRGAQRIARALSVVADLGAGLADFRHVVVSPPQEWASSKAVTLDGFRELKGAAWDVLRDCGALGAVLIFHPYRQNDGFNTWRIGPHFHAIVYGHADSSRRPSDWIVKDLGVVPEGRLFPLAYYLLSHAGVSENLRKIPAYFGMCSTAGRSSPVRVAEYVQDSPRACSCCGGGLYRYSDWARAGQFGRPSLAPVTQRETWRIWVARKDKERARAILDGMSQSEALAVAYGQQWMCVVHDSGPPRFNPSEVDAEGLRG